MNLSEQTYHLILVWPRTPHRPNWKSNKRFLTAEESIPFLFPTGESGKVWSLGLSKFQHSQEFSQERKSPGRKERRPYYVNNMWEGTSFGNKRNMISFCTSVVKCFSVKILALISLLGYNFLIEVQGGWTTQNHLYQKTEDWLRAQCKFWAEGWVVHVLGQTVQGLLERLWV